MIIIWKRAKQKRVPIKNWWSTVIAISPSLIKRSAMFFLSSKNVFLRHCAEWKEKRGSMANPHRRTIVSTVERLITPAMRMRFSEQVWGRRRRRTTDTRSFRPRGFWKHGWSTETCWPCVNASTHYTNTATSAKGSVYSYLRVLESKAAPTVSLTFTKTTKSRSPTHSHSKYKKVWFIRWNTIASPQGRSLHRALWRNYQQPNSILLLFISGQTIWSVGVRFKLIAKIRPWISLNHYMTVSLQARVRLKRLSQLSLLGQATKMLRWGLKGLKIVRFNICLPYNYHSRWIKYLRSR